MRNKAIGIIPFWSRYVDSHLVGGLYPIHREDCLSPRGNFVSYELHAQQREDSVKYPSS